jgi:hypothetical protein
MRPLPTLLLAVVALTSGLALGSLASPRLQETSPLQAPAPSGEPASELEARLARLEDKIDALHATVFAVSQGGAGNPANGPSIDQVAAALRRELERSARSTSLPQEQARAEQVAIEAKPENAPAQARAERVVSQALTARRWTMEDAQALRESLASLSPQQGAALLEQLVPAVNRGEIEVETRGPLF